MYARLADQPAVCTGDCGLLAEPGDVFCTGCREGHERDRPYHE